MRIEIYQGKIFILIYGSYDHQEVVYVGFDEDYAKEVENFKHVVNPLGLDTDEDDECMFILEIWEDNTRTAKLYHCDDGWKEEEVEIRKYPYDNGDEEDTDEW